MDDMCDFRGIVARMVTCAFGLDMEQCWMWRCFECCSSSSSSSDFYTDWSSASFFQRVVAVPVFMQPFFCSKLGNFPLVVRKEAAQLFLLLLLLIWNGRAGCQASTIGDGGTGSCEQSGTWCTQACCATGWVPSPSFVPGGSSANSVTAPECDDGWSPSWYPGWVGWNQSWSPQVSADSASVQDQEPSLPPHPLPCSGWEYPGNNT